MNRIPRPSASALLRALREWPGWFTLAGGAVLCVLGWYGVSGESLAARQLPYLASATAPGAALIVAGAVLIAGRQGHGGGGPPDRRLEQLYALLVSEAPGGGPERGEAPAPSTGTGAVVLPHGTLYHRPDCPLAAGKPGAAPVDAEDVDARGLGPCPVCDPEPPPGGGPPAGPGSPAAPEPPADSGPPPAPDRRT